MTRAIHLSSIIYGISAICKQCRAKLKTELESKLSIPSVPLMCDIGAIAQQKDDLMQASFVSSTSPPKPNSSDIEVREGPL